MEKHIIELKRILDGSQGERSIHAYLKKHPRLVAEAFCPSRATARVVSEFSFGDKYRADFLAGVPMSGGWFISLVELEPVDCVLFTKKRQPAKHLHAALSQVRAWKIFEEKRRDSLVQQVSEAFQYRDLYIPGRSQEEPRCSAGLLMHDPACMIGFIHVVVIGRRERLSKEELSLKAAFDKTDHVMVHTYDHLLDSARYFREDN